MFRDYVSRRAFLSTCSQYGLGATLFPGVLWAMADGAPEITTSMIADAAKVAAVEIPDEYREMMLDELNDLQKQYVAIRELRIPNDVAPALLFDPVLPGTTFDTTRRPARLGPAPRVGTPKNV